MNQIRHKFFVLALFCTSQLTNASLPIEFGGNIGFESTRLNNYKRSSDSGLTTNNGSYGLNGVNDDAFLQSYIFRLSPNIVVNDHVTVKAEISTGSARGGYAGDSTALSGSNNSVGAAHYLHTQPAQSQENTLHLNQAYMEIYSDLATFKVGRYSRDWGLGAIFNKGDKVFDRFFTYYDGFEGIFNLGKIYMTPYWANMSNGSSLTRNTEVKEMGIDLVYDNPDKDLKMGIHLSKRKAGGQNSLYTYDHDNNATTDQISQGSANTKLIDIFFRRYLGRFMIAAEVPMLSGEVGHVYDSATNSEFQASAYLFETSYELNNKWTIGFDFGKISGDKGSSNDFEALYLHPNYQIAEIMFRYNLRAISDTSTGNVYDSSMANATYYKLSAHYLKGLWKWNFAFIMAKANETATIGRAYQHEDGYSFTSTKSQDDDMGYELDLTFDYQWNPNLVLSGTTAWYKPGDYYSFTNTASDIGLKNQLAAGLKLGLNF